MGRQAPANTYHVVSSWIWNQRSLTRSERGHTANYSIQSSLYRAKRMLPTTTHEDITPLARRLLICAWIASEDWPIIAPDYKVSSSSTVSVAVPDPVWDRYYWKDYRLITALITSHQRLFRAVIWLKCNE